MLNIAFMKHFALNFLTTFLPDAYPLKIAAKNIAFTPAQDSAIFTCGENLK